MSGAEKEVIYDCPVHDGSSRRKGDTYLLSDEERDAFLTQGFCVLRGFLTEEELQPIEKVFTTFLNGEVTGMGKDFCDMSGVDRKPEDFDLINAMLPRQYMPSFANNPYERRVASVAKALLGDDMEYDYDQFLAKKPGREGAVFSWHQDMAYWPRKTPDFRTVTASLALDDADVENGCLRVVPASNHSGLRNHKPLAQQLKNTDSAREDSHAQVMELRADDSVIYLPVRRGDITLHDAWIVHGSGGNRSKRWRRTYVTAFRSTPTIQYERKIGFTHSHNDKTSWDEFERLGL
jgi:hypothetical protein